MLSIVVTVDTNIHGLVESSQEVLQKGVNRSRPKEAGQRLTIMVIAANQWIYFLSTTLLSFYPSFNAALSFP